MLTVADMLKDLTLDQARREFSSGHANHEKIGRYTCSGGWFFIAKGIPSSFKATDICWTYISRKTTVYTNRSSFYTVNRLEAQTYPKGVFFFADEINDSLPKDFEEFYVRLQAICPWVIFGHGDSVNNLWTQDKESFRTLINKRIDLIKAGLSDGSLSIQSDGSISTVELSSKLPQFLPWYNDWYRPIEERKKEQEAALLAAKEAKITGGTACACCGNAFSWLNRENEKNLDQIAKVCPKYIGKKLCKKCARQLHVI
jgi:hypothetical protein